MMIMDANVVSCTTTVPPGFRFHPTDEELVGYYLRKKIASQKIDFNVITDIDLYKIEPWDLQEKCGIGYEEQKEWYFFSRKYKKYPTGTRTNRATMAGFWKATGRDKAVYDKSELIIIGMRKTLVFYKGRAPNGQKTDWVMREYRLQSQNTTPHYPQEEGWVLCKAFKKQVGGRGRSNKDDEQFAALPRLQSPAASSPSMLPAESYKLHNYCMSKEEEDEEMSIMSDKKVSDWRALEKFVASQLSNDDLCFEYRNISDVALLAAIAER